MRKAQDKRNEKHRTTLADQALSFPFRTVAYLTNEQSGVNNKGGNWFSAGRLSSYTTTTSKEINDPMTKDDDAGPFLRIFQWGGRNDKRDFAS